VDVTSDATLVEHIGGVLPDRFVSRVLGNDAVTATALEVGAVATKYVVVSVTNSREQWECQVNLAPA
jgi:hypothetical protein